MAGCEAQERTETPNPAAISTALCQRCVRESSNARKIAACVRELTPFTCPHARINCSGSAIRNVAVGGA